MERVRIRVLGPLEAEVGAGPADLGGPRQRAVLALLLVARGEVVSVDRLIDDLWRGEPPPRATGALQAYVSNLRRALEPSRAPRSPAQVLVSAPPGYAVRLPDDAVDAWEFGSLLAQAASARADAAMALLTGALALWRGPAFAEYAAQPWATAAAARLDELRVVARERLVDAEIRSGRYAEAVVGAQALVSDIPLREEGWRLLALAQYADGRQADALGTLRRARTLLADELGIDPGPALLALEQDVLTQSVELPRAGKEPAAALAAPPAPTRPPAPPRREPDLDFVGRDAELATLRAAAQSARAGTLAFGLVGGDAGSGKSALLAHLRRSLEDDGWRVAVGRCPESAGGPPAWAWAEALRELAAQRDPGEYADALAPLLSDAAAAGPPDAVVGRFRLHRAVQQWLAELDDRPMAVLLDDVHRADAETRSLLTTLLDHGLPNRVFVVLAFRPEDTPELDELRAALARHAPARVRLSGLAEDAAAALIESVTGTAPDPDVVRALTARTDGNPFYLTESARLLASEGEVVATSQVPEGVGDVLRRRFARLPEETVAVLRLAAVAGRDVDVALLVEAAEVPEDAVLDALESGLISGLLVEPGPGRVRFSHLLVRETLYAGISRLRRARWHARMADAVATLYPQDLSALAYHSVEAATPATAAVAAERAVAAAGLAEGRYAYDAAIGLYRDALRMLDLLPDPPLAERIAVLRRLMGAQLRFGATIAAAAVKEGVDLAEQAGDDRLLVDVLTAWQVPTPWVTRRYGYVDEELITTIHRVLDTVELSSRERCLVLFALVRETAHGGDDRPERAVTEMIALARSIGDPELIALALSASNVVYLADLRPDEQAAMVNELGDLGRRHGLVLFEQLAEVYATQHCGVQLDLDGFAEHLERARQLAHEYHLGQAIVVVTALTAILAFMGGDLDAAEARWREAGVIQSRIGGVDAKNQVLLATFILAYLRGQAGEMVPLLRAAYAAGTPLARDCLALGLSVSGDLDEARTYVAGLPELSIDYLWTLFTAIRGLVFAAVGDAERGADYYDRLLPYRGIVAGSGSTGYAFIPVALVLGRLARMLGRVADAQVHFAEARAVAERCGNAVWLALVEDDEARTPVESSA